MRSVGVVVRSNRGEMFTYTFADLPQALEFMQTYDERRDMTLQTPLLCWSSRRHVMAQ